MRVFGLSLSLFLLLPLCLFSQATKDGFIIVNNGQFKYGSIQIGNIDSQYTECFFKESSKSEFKKYTSNEIEGYGVINESKFVTRQIEIHSESQKIFLKVEFEGLVKLYSYRNRIFAEESSFVELLEANDVYKNNLSDLMKSCKNSASAIKHSVFTTKSIISLLKRYDQCSKTNFELPKRININLEAVAGVEYNSTQLTSHVPLFYFANVRNLKDKTLLSTGIRVQISSSRIKSLSFCTGLYYYQQQFYLLSASQANASIIDKMNFNFNEFVVPINLQYGSDNEKKKLRPYVRGGISIPFVTNSSLTLEHSEETNNVVYLDQYDAMKSFKESIQIDVAGGVNFNVSKKIRSFVELHFNTGKGEIVTNLSNTETIESKSKRFNILVGIRF
ncbi:MAG: hypothetical protein ABI663_02690 [Chryseolinea sp.]